MVVRLNCRTQIPKRLRQAYNAVWGRLNAPEGRSGIGSQQQNWVQSQWRTRIRNADIAGCAVLEPSHCATSVTKVSASQISPHLRYWKTFESSRAVQLASGKTERYAAMSYPMEW